jgi:hypothetical protein
MLYTTINFARQREQRIQEWMVWSVVQNSISSRKKTSNSRKHLVSVVSVVGLIASSIITSAYLFPDTFYRFIPVEVVPIEAKTPESPLGGLYSEGTFLEIVLPPRDENLPDGNWLIILKLVSEQRLGVRGSRDSLRDSVWRRDELPLQRHGPMILLAHRFGCLKWSNQYRRQNSFTT